MFIYIAQFYFKNISILAVLAEAPGVDWALFRFNGWEKAIDGFSKSSV